VPRSHWRTSITLEEYDCAAMCLHLMSFSAVFGGPQYIGYILLNQSISYEAPAVDMQEFEYQTMTRKILNCMASYTDEFYIS